MQFDEGQRVWHRARSMAATYIARDDFETSYVEFDDGDTLRITTALLEPLADQEARR
jgi:hypothetical protein